MFDHIKFETDCPCCGNPVTGFQSKDGPCELKTLNYKDVDNFYAICDYCSTWIEYVRVKEKPDVPIDDYSMIFRAAGIHESRFTRNEEGKIIAISGGRNKEVENG